MHHMLKIHFKKTKQTFCVFCAAILTFLTPTSVLAQNTSSEFKVIHKETKASEGTHLISHMETDKGTVYQDSSEKKDTDLSSKISKKAEALPSSYRLAEPSACTPIRDQGYTGCCWAFSSIKSLETNGLKTGLLTPETADFSESHLAWFSYHPSSISTDPLYEDGVSQSAGYSLTHPYDNGGSAIFASYTLAKWCGPNLESSFPFSAASYNAVSSMATSMVPQKNRMYEAAYHVQNAISFDDYIIGDYFYSEHPEMKTEMKQAIMNQGALSIAIYFDKIFLKQSTSSAYYQTAYTGEKAIKNTNHCVAVVGWDDNYSRTNFKTAPEGDGAWLIANSFGSSYGDNGYFWLSYYDPSICECYSFSMEPASNYKNIYQYDGFGWNNATYSSGKDLKAANIFTAKSSEPEQVDAVSFYTLTQNQSCKVQIYRSVKKSPTNGVLVSEATTTANFAQNGYHTLKLNSPVTLNPGEQFSVVVTYLKNGNEKVYVPFEGTNTSTTDLKLKFSSKSGQSFIYAPPSSGGQRVWKDSSELGYNNVCVKAFTNPASYAAATLPSTIKTLVLGKGETYQITEKDKSFTTNDSSIITVSASGKVTAKAPGTTKISVADESESHLIKFTVKKAPAKIKLNVSAKKTVRKGKTFRLKAKLPAGTASYHLRYHSSKPSVARISSKGVVKAKKKGTTTLRITTFNGKKAKVKLTVR